MCYNKVKYKYRVPAKVTVKEAELTDSDFSASLNLSATRADDTTIWPDNDLLPDDFDTNYAKEDEEDEEGNAISEY